MTTPNTPPSMSSVANTLLDCIAAGAELPSAESLRIDAFLAPSGDRYVINLTAPVSAMTALLRAAVTRAAEAERVSIESVIFDLRQADIS